MAGKRVAPRDPLRVATESFRPYWESVRRLMIQRNGEPFDATSFCEMARITATEYEIILRSMSDPEERPSLSFNVVDRVMVSVDMQYLMQWLYVVNETEEKKRLQDLKAKKIKTPRSRATQERWTRIKKLWDEGDTIQQIAWNLDSSVKSISVAMSKMRDAGWDLPHRGHRFKNRDEGLASAA
jgi:hypothetical protein